MSVGDSFDYGFPFYLLEGHQGDQPRSDHCNADFASEQLCVSSIDCNFSTWVPRSSLYFGTELQVSEREQKCSILLFPENGCQALCARCIFAVQQGGSLCAHTEASCIQLIATTNDRTGFQSCHSLDDKGLVGSQDHVLYEEE
jgi:hypothetical protein